MSKKRHSEAQSARQQPSELLRVLIEKYWEKLIAGAGENAKVGDLIRMMEFYQKIAPDDSSQSRMWRNLEQIRRQVLAGKSRPEQKPAGDAVHKENGKSRS